jgi:Tfp pilus assembly protein PilF
MLSRTLPLVEGYTDKTIEQAKQLLEKAIELDPQRRNVYKSMSERLEKTLQCSSNDIKSLYEFFCLNKSLN